MIKSVIFDLGGVYFTDGTTIAIKKISDKYNLEPELVLKSIEFDTELGRLYRKGEITIDTFWNQVKKLLGVNASNHNLNKMWMESYEPIKGTIKIIEQLKENGIKLYFLSDNVKERSEYLQKRYKFLKNFIDGIFSYKVHKTKADGIYTFRLALEKTGNQPEEVIYVDDKKEFVETAKELGINVIHFKNPEQLKEELKSLGVL